VTSTEGNLAILGIKTIKILIVGLAGGITATPNLPPVEIIAGTPDVKTVVTDVPTAEADVPTAGTDSTTAAIIAAPVRMTEILEVVAGRTVTEITEAAEVILQRKEAIQISQQKPQPLLQSNWRTQEVPARFNSKRI
jgi:hypothetical protein